MLERHALDPRGGGYWEVRRRDWSEAGPEARLSDRDMNEKKSMNNHLHLLEAFAGLSRVWDDPRVKERLRELLALFEQRIWDAPTGHFNHFFDEQWNVRSDTCTFGHDIEGSWLLCEAAEALADPPLLRRVEPVALRLAETVLREGVGPGGGLFYEGRAGNIIDAGREWWPRPKPRSAFSTPGKFPAMPSTAPPPAPPGITLGTFGGPRSWRMALAHPPGRPARSNPAQGQRMEVPLPRRARLPGNPAAAKFHDRKRIIRKGLD